MAGGLRGALGSWGSCDPDGVRWAGGGGVEGAGGGGEGGAGGARVGGHRTPQGRLVGLVGAVSARARSGGGECCGGGEA